MWAHSGAAKAARPAVCQKAETVGGGRVDEVFAGGSTGVALGFTSCNACYVVYVGVRGRDLVNASGFGLRVEAGLLGVESVELADLECLHEQIGVCGPGAPLSESGSPAAERIAELASPSTATPGLQR